MAPRTPTVPKVDDCPDAAAKHTPCPKSYLGWHDWAAHKAKTHRQIKCPTCGFYAVWVPRQKPHPFDAKTAQRDGCDGDAK